MSGRLVITTMAVFAIVMSVFFYKTLKESPQHRQLATSQMEKEFSDYAAAKKVERLKVAEQGPSKYWVEMNADWKFLIHDKTLFVVPPTPISFPSVPNEAMTAETKEAARKSVHSFIFDWLVEKFQTQKNVEVEVRFPDEPLPQ